VRNIDDLYNIVTISDVLWNFSCNFIANKKFFMKLFVAGLPNDFDDIDLKEMFELYGEVRSAKLVVDKATGKSKGFGFVDMPDKSEAEQTIESLDGAGLRGGKKMSVKEAEDKPRTSPGPNSNTYGRGNRGNSSGDGRFNRRY
jgi:cold-inducible RNA-binding protein